MLDNGLTVLVRTDRTAPVVAIVTHVKAGYFDETDDVVGIAHVLEHMFFKGTPTRGVGDIAKDTKGSGGYLNAHTIYDNTSYYTVLPSSGFVAGLEIQADAYTNSMIDAGELEKELEVIIQEAKRKADNPPVLAVETLYELLHDVHRMRRWRIGREPGLRALDRDAMLRFYRNYYRPSNTILSIVGDVESDDVMQRVGDLYGSLPDATPERSPGGAEPHREELRYRELAGDIAQTQLVFGWRTPATMHEDTPILDFAANILAAGRASRLYRALRERQLAASVTAYNYTPTELGVFVVQAETRPDRSADAARAVWDQMRALRDDPVEPLELERVRRIFEARWIRRLESMEGQANHLTEWEALGAWQLGDEYYARFMAVKADDIHQAVRRHLTPDSAGIVVYRPSSSPPIAADVSQLLAALESERPEPLAPLPPHDSHSRTRPASPALFERVEGGVSVFRSASGLPILVRPRSGAAIAHIAIQAVGGVRNEPSELAGISTLVARTMIKGTTSRTAERIAEEAEMLGGSIGPSVGAESFGWSISVPVQHLEAAAELLSDVVRNAVIPPDALETERTVALADLDSMRDDMFRFPMRLVMSAAYDQHPYARSNLGTEDSLRAIDVERARDWYRNELLSAPLVVGIAGDLVAEDAAGIMARELAGLSPSSSHDLLAPVWPAAVRVLAETRDKAQTALAIAFPGPARRDARRFAAQLIATIASGLGGRFFDELRDRQSLAYTVHAYTSQHTQAGMFLSYIATSPDKETIARAGLLAEFAKLSDTLVTEEELARAKAYTIGSRAIRQENGGAVLGDILDAWMFGSGLSELEELDSMVAAVTREEIQQLAATFFDPDRRVEGIVRGTGRAV